MPISPEALLARLAELGITVKTVQHPPVYTVAESRWLRGEIAGTHTKNLFLRDAKRRHFLVCLEEDTAVDLKQLRKLIDARGKLSFGSPESLRELLGVEPGSVSPMCAINDLSHAVTVVVEEKLLQGSCLNCHPLINDRTTTITPDGLLRFLKATEHDPVIVSIESGAAPAPPVSTGQN